MIAPPSMLVEIISADTTILKSPTLAVDAVKVVFNILQKSSFLCYIKQENIGKGRNEYKWWLKDVRIHSNCCRVIGWHSGMYYVDRIMRLMVMGINHLRLRGWAL
jgi:hypothetical protein